MELEKPDLYRLADDPRRLTLRAGRCTDCGALIFPLSPYGCTACGADPSGLREEPMSGRAQLLTFITIHQKLAPGLTPPCVVGEARLANGEIHEIMLAGAGDLYADDMEVEAVATEITRGDTALIACRFAPVEG